MGTGRTAYVQKYKCIINGTEIPDVIGVTGLGLGEEGTVEVPEVDIKPDVSDGVRKLSPLTLRIAKKQGLKAFNYFTDWWPKRHTDFKDVSIALYDVSMTQELHRYFFPECELKSFNEEDQERASPKLGVIVCILLPYGAELVKP